MNDLFEVDDKLVVTKFLKNCDLADSSARNSVVAMVNLDLLHCYGSVSSELKSFIDDSIGTLAKPFAVLILVFEFFRCLNGAIVTTAGPTVSRPVWLFVLLRLLLLSCIILRATSHR